MKMTKSLLNEYDWLLLARILTNDSDLKLALQMVFQITNRQRAKQMEEELSKGKRLKDILVMDSFERDVGYYSEIVPFVKSIELVYSKRQRKKSMKGLIVQKLSYPMVIFIASLIVLTIFSDYVLPTMVSSINGIDTTSIILGFNVVRIVRNLLLLLAIVFICLIAYIQINHLWSYIWMIAHKLKKDRWFKLIGTYQFTEELIVLLETNLSLLDGLELIRYNKSQPLAAVIAANLHNDLLNGIDFERGIQSEFFDPSFAAVLIYELKKREFREALIGYRDIITQRLQQMIQRCSLAVQIGCYVFVSVVIVIAYQLLLLPLEMLNSL